MSKYSEVFSRDALDTLFPKDRSNQFFDALFGDASEGAYDITLEFDGTTDNNTLNFKIHLNQRPGKCLACNLTYGLPEVFSRHPVLDFAGVAAKIADLIGHPTDKIEWKLGTTQSTSKELHSIPFTIRLV